MLAELLRVVTSGSSVVLAVNARYLLTGRIQGASMSMRHTNTAYVALIPSGGRF